MGVNHTFTASDGDLITPARWNAAHSITGEVTVQAITLFSDAEGYAISCASLDTWYPSSDSPDSNFTRVGIPGELMPDYDRSRLAVHWRCNYSDTSATCEVQVKTVAGGDEIGWTQQTGMTSGQHYSSMSAEQNISGNFPAGQDDVVVRVKCNNVTGSTIYIYSVILYLYENS